MRIVRALGLGVLVGSASSVVSVVVAAITPFHSFR